MCLFVNIYVCVNVCVYVFVCLRVCVVCHQEEVRRVSGFDSRVLVTHTNTHTPNEVCKQSVKVNSLQDTLSLQRCSATQ